MLQVKRELLAALVVRVTAGRRSGNLLAILAGWGPRVDCSYAGPESGSCWSKGHSLLVLPDRTKAAQARGSLSALFAPVMLMLCAICTPPWPTGRGKGPRGEPGSRCTRHFLVMTPLPSVASGNLTGGGRLRRWRARGPSAAGPTSGRQRIRWAPFTARSA
jgi:hypothetical protein